MGYIIIYSVVLLLICLCICAIAIYTIARYKANGDKARNDDNNNLQSAELLSSFVGQISGQAFLILSAEDKKPLYVSENVRYFFGIESETIYRDLYAICSCVPHEAFSELRHKFLSSGGKEDFVHEFVFNGERAEKGFAAAHISFKNIGGTDVIAVIINDITESKKAAENAKEQILQMQLSGQTKMNFLSNMSHEIRTPMNGIIGMMSLARMNIDDHDAVRDYLDKASNLSEFLLSLINDILDISKIESGKLELEHTELDLFSIRDKIYNMFSKTIGEKGIKYSVDFVEPDVRYVMGDELRLMQILINLISNASKFTKAGKTIEVTFKQCSRSDDKVKMLFRVRDTGQGMSQEFLQHIFKPFEQEKASTARLHGGSGLGMAITDNLVRLMGGNIVVTSELGVGSEFNIFLPFEVSDGRLSSQNDFSSSELESITYEGMRVLVAEDNNINAQICKKMLTKCGADVDRAENGVQAVKMFCGSGIGEYDVILMDIQMPEMDGLEATRQIRRSGRTDASSIPIIALSADAFAEDKQRSLAAGMDAHISKPVDYKALIKTIARIILAKKNKQ